MKIKVAISSGSNKSRQGMSKLPDNVVDHILDQGLVINKVLFITWVII